MDNTLKAYRARWEAVEEIERKELQSASMELRWQQLNSLYLLAIGLGIDEPEKDEIKVFQRWAKLKERAASQLPTK
jgi:hypothetical protein